MNVSPIPPQLLVCSAPPPRWSKGIFFGESPFAASSPTLIAQIATSSFLTSLLNRFFAPLGQSLFISQILAGVILGPTFLGKFRWFRDTLFPVESFYMIDMFSLFGVIFFSFIIGVKTDLSLVQKSGKKAFAIGICTFLFPLLLNCIVTRLMTLFIPMESKLYRSILWIGTFQAISSFYAIVCLLADLKLMNSEIGKLAISSSTLSGICSYIWTFTVFTGQQSVHAGHTIFLIKFIFLGIIVVVTIVIFRPIALRIIRLASNAKSVTQTHISVIFILVLISALYGEWFGMKFIFGPMILGMAIPDGPPLGSALVEKIEFFITYNMLPILFVASASGLDFSSISLRNLVIIESTAIIACLCKIAGVMLPSFYWRVPTSHALCLGLILSNQGMLEVLLLGRAKSAQLIDEESYTIMVISITVITGILAPIVKLLYKPSRRYTKGKVMTIQHIHPNADLRILACLHHQEHTPTLLNLFEASFPHHDRRMLFYVIHLLDLAGRTAPVLVAHDPANRNVFHSNESEHIINALRYFELKNQGFVGVYPYTSISPYASMHSDVCSLAAEKGVSLVIVLFHKHPVIQGCEGEAGAKRSVNSNILKESPCSVGILVDLNLMSHCPSAMLSAMDVYRVGVIFLGGPDDRESMCYACCMARHPNIRLTLVRFLDGSTYSCPAPDLDALSMYKEAQMQNKECFYQEEVVKDTVGVVNTIRSMDGCFDLVLVGRRHEESGLLAGLSEWNENPELGSVGDMLLSMGSDFRATILVVQQGLSENEDFFDDEFECSNYRQDSFNLGKHCGSNAKVP